MTNLNPVKSITKDGDKYTIVWSSDDGKNITAELTKNKDVKITNKE